jgi:hypothetical protein
LRERCGTGRAVVQPRKHCQGGCHPLHCAHRPPFLEEEFKTYFSDTICGLVEHLQKNGVAPDDAEIYEIYREHETSIPASLLADADGRWLTKQELCRAFERHYPGHIREGSCDFEDRERGCLGP